MSALWVEAWSVVDLILFGPNLPIAWIGLAVIAAVWYAVEEIRDRRRHR